MMRIVLNQLMVDLLTTIKTMKTTETILIPPVDLDRLVRRCADYNNEHGTDYTPETYDEARTRVPLVVAWDNGWETCEANLLAILAQTAEHSHPQD